MNNNLNDNKWCVYMHRNKINNKTYIGITSKQPAKRWGNNGCNYRNSQPVFYNAIQKYGWDNFEHIIFIDNLQEEQAKHIEKLLISLYKTNCTQYKEPEYGYNMTDGGDGVVGTVRSQTTRQKISDAAKNRSQETRVKISEAAKERFKNPENHPMYGRHLSDETKQKISKKTKERLAVLENNPWYGKKHTEESKRKIGDGHRNPSDETRNKMSESAKARCTEEWREWQRDIANARYELNKELINGKYVATNNPMYGKKHADESKNKMMMSNRSRKTVYQFNILNCTTTTYNSVREAERITGISKYRITKSCNTGEIVDSKYSFSFTMED